MMSKDDEDIIFFAFRYALGRRTAAPSLVLDYITPRWTQFSQHTQKQFLDEAMTAIERGMAGAECDVVQWLRLPKLNGDHVCECKWTSIGWSYRPGCQWHDKAKWPHEWKAWN